MWAVTLKQLRDAGACFEGYNKVVCMLSGSQFDADRESYMRFKHDAPISLIDIAKNNGLDDALWATRCVHGYDRDLRLYAVWCAKKVQRFMADARSVAALVVAERFANGNATKDELSAAMAAARVAVYDAATAARASAREAALASVWHHAHDATDAARYAAWASAKTAAERAANKEAVWVSTWDASYAAQKTMFIKMCHGKAPWQQQKGNEK